MKQTLIALIFITTATLFACKSESTTTPSETFSGITQTKEDGTIISTDPNDWLPVACTGSNCNLNALAFFPNPCAIDAELDFNILRDMNLEILLYSAPGKMSKSLYNTQYITGHHTITINPTGLEPGIYRLYINATIDGKKYTTFGDIQVTK